MAHPEGRAIVPDKLNELNKLTHDHLERDCCRCLVGVVAGARYREAIRAGRGSGVALGGGSGAAAASAQSAQSRHQHQNAEHRAPTAPPRGNPKEEQNGQ